MHNLALVTLGFECLWDLFIFVLYIAACWHIEICTDTRNQVNFENKYFLKIEKLFVLEAI